MKKVFVVFSFAVLMASCNGSASQEVSTTDSTSVETVDSTSGTKVDTTAVEADVVK